MKMKRYGYLAICVMLSSGVLSGAGAAKAYAASGGGNDALECPRPEIGLSQAVAAAETYAAGRAVRAELERRHDGRPSYEVEVVSGRKVLDVRVDQRNGRVLAATVDKTDHDDGRDAED